MKTKLLCTVLLVCCGSGTAKADWEYTKWGMTPQQVVSASKNQAREGSDLRPDSDGNVSRLTAPYQSEGVLYEAQFGFDTAGKLASVTLVLDDPSASMEMDMGADARTHMTMDSNKPQGASSNQGACRALQSSIDNTYGPPQGGGSADMVYTIETWRDERRGNAVKFTVLYGTGCFVQYGAMRPAGAH